MFRQYTPPPDLPDAVKQSVEAAENRVTLLQTEEKRIISRIGELKNELVAQEKSVSELDGVIGKNNAKIATQTAKIEKNEDTIFTQEIAIQKIQDEITALNEEKKKLKPEVDRLIATREELALKKEEAINEIQDEKDEWAKKRKTLEALVFATSKIIELLPEIVPKEVEKK